MPFTAEDFTAVLVRYNLAVWPAQPLLVVMAAGLILLARSGGRAAARTVWLGLAFLWAWAGIGYHLLFFRAVNPAASVFALLFVAQAGILAREGFSGRTPVRRAPDLRGRIGMVLVAIALAVYPLLSASLGHHFPAAPTFGLPCPVTLYTLGMVLGAAGHGVRPTLVAIPLVWAAIGSTAAIKLGMTEDLLLAAAALLVLPWLRPARSSEGGIHVPAS